MKNTFILDLQVATTSQTDLPSENQMTEWITVVLRPFYDNAELTIRIVDENESQTLNRTYRNKDSATNVLSFPFESPLIMDRPLLGDLVICKAVVEREAQAQHKSLQSHWAHMIVHGILHLLGYDHMTDEQAHEMETLEIEIMETLGFNNPYQCNDDERHRG